MNQPRMCRLCSEPTHPRSSGETPLAWASARECHPRKRWKVSVCALDLDPDEG